MKTFKTPDEITNTDVLKSVLREIAAFDISDSASPEMDPVVFLEEALAFDLNEFGGLVYILENLEDLDKVPTLSGAPLSEQESEFDIVEFVGKNKEFVMLFLATNNGGGATYYVPRALYETSPTLMKSIADHELMGGSVQAFREADNANNS